MKKYLDVLRSAYRINGKRFLHRPRVTGREEHADAQATTASEQLAATGLAVIPDFWPASDCTALRTAFEATLANGVPGTWQDKVGSDARIFGFERYDDHARNFLKDPWIDHIKREYYVAEPTQLAAFAMVNRVVYREGNLGSGGGWHRDAVHEQQLKAIMYLTDVEAENGAFQYLLNTHRKASIYDTILHHGINYEQFRFTEAEIAGIVVDQGAKYPLQTVTGRAGTLILADTSGIHRGSPIVRDRRYAITQYLYRQPEIGGKGIPPAVRKALENTT
ncbi:MAG: phytanoyl-CoA dioxygenase family protein [Bacteroidota bacterium]